MSALCANLNGRELFQNIKKQMKYLTWSVISVDLIVMTLTAGELFYIYAKKTVEMDH